MKGHEKRYDVIVVGAGPAGCSAAFFAASYGASVLLADKLPFPREKACGDGISPRALAVLDRIGASRAIEASCKSMKIHSVLVFSPSGAKMQSGIPVVPGFRNYGIVLSRKAFDHLLFNHVSRVPHIDILLGGKVTGLVRKGGEIGGVTVVYGGRQLDIKAATVIGADGAHSAVAKALSLTNDLPRHRAFGIRAYVKGIEGLKDRLEIHYDQHLVPGYGWVFPLGEDRANIGVGVFNRRRGNSTPSALFKRFLSHSPGLDGRLSHASIESGTLRGWPITMGSFPRRRGDGNAILIGDAGSMTDPLTGEGIYAALRSGELAAKALQLWNGGKAKGNSFSDVYEQLWRREFRWHEFLPSTVYRTLLQSRTFANFAVARAARNPRRAMVIAGAIIHLLPKRRLFFSF